MKTVNFKRVLYLCLKFFKEMKNIFQNCLLPFSEKKKDEMNN